MIVVGLAALFGLLGLVLIVVGVWSVAVDRRESRPGAGTDWKTALPALLMGLALIAISAAFAWFAWDRSASLGG